VQGLALDGEVVEHDLAGLVGLLDDGAALLPRVLDEGLAVDLGRLHQPLGGEASVVIDLRGGVLGLGDERRGPLLGLDQVGGGALLALGEDLGASLLGLGRDPTGLLVRGAQDRGTLGAQRTGERRFVEGGIGGAALGLTELVLELADPRFEVAHLARDHLEVDADLVGVEAALAQGREVHACDLGRRLTRGRVDSAFVHSFQTTAWRTGDTA
jgi:hypothetical protein